MLRLFVPIALLLIGCAQDNHYDRFGAEFLGLPYLNNPLGEGVAPDSDPTIRFDAFDCATFTETVLANSDIDKLNKIRYRDGKIDFLHRNHFIETDWLQNNSDIVQNASGLYAPTKTRRVTTNKRKWFKTVHNTDVDFATQTVDLEYIPYADAHNINIYEPMVVLFIVDSPKIRNKTGTDLAVRHMGFLLPDGRLRHASRRKKHVVDDDFHEYINRMVENKNNLGIMLLEIKK